MGRVMAQGAGRVMAQGAAAGATGAADAAFFNVRANMAAYRYISPKKSIRGENSVSASDVEINSVTSGA